MARRDHVEWWFVRRGLPHAIDDYTARENVWTRAWPFLLLVLSLESFATFSDRYRGWHQVGVFISGPLFAGLAFIGLNAVLRRRLLSHPTDIGTPELGFFVVVPAVLQWFVVERSWPAMLFNAAINLAILAVAYVVTSYGLLPALWRGALQAGSQLRNVIRLVARSLPLLLLITAFVFLNAEMWQVAHDFTPPLFTICVGLLLALSLGFLALQVPSEVAQLGAFSSWSQVCELCRQTDAPLGDLDYLASRPEYPEPDPLSRVELINIAVLLTASHAVQALVVGVAAGSFYVLFGVLAVRRETILQWTTVGELDPLIAFHVGSTELVMVWEHLAVACFVAAFSVLQFTVASITDDTYRANFYEEASAEVREVLAVRAAVRYEPEP